jgi:hypothetical protein
MLGLSDRSFGELVAAVKAKVAMATQRRDFLHIRLRKN